MSLNTVTLKWDLSNVIQAGLAATLSITPTAQMSDTTDHILIPPVPQTMTFLGSGQMAGIVANDNSAISPAGTGYLISVTAANGQVVVPQFQTQILFANGAIQWLDVLATVPVVTTSYQYQPLASNTPAAGQVLTATGSGQASMWATALSAVAATPLTGFTLQNGTPTILSWTAPADGNMHFVATFGNVKVTTNESGGAINGVFTDPGGNAGSAAIDPGGHNVSNTTFTSKLIAIQPGSTFTLSQSSALLSGAAVAYAALWAV